VDFLRQSAIVGPADLPPVTVIGAGGIGSFVLLALTKMGVGDVTVWDFDTVEEHNAPNQLYGPKHVGMNKVDAAQQICESLAGVDTFKYTSYTERFHPPVDGVVVSGVDSMAARKEIWDSIKYQPIIPLYVDARMGAQVCRINSIDPCDPEHIRWYEETLTSDEEALQEPCTARAIVYNGFMIASLVANQVKKFAKREEVMKEIIFDMVTLTMLTTP
jgi:hypothetical protein